MKYLNANNIEFLIESKNKISFVKCDYKNETRKIKRF